MRLALEKLLTNLHKKCFLCFGKKTMPARINAIGESERFGRESEGVLARAVAHEVFSA